MFQKLKLIYLHSHFQLPLILSFLLPFGINYAPLMIVWLLFFFIFDNVQIGLIKLFKSNWCLILLSFFLIHAAAYFFSNNKIDALSNIEIKLSFIAFPILIYSSELREMQLKKIIFSFVSGCIIVCMICIFRATYLKIFSNENSFYSSEFACFMHPSYFAMYLVFAQCCVLLFYKNWLSHLFYLNYKIVFISGLLLLSIFLCSSKMGLITSILIIPSIRIIQMFMAGHFKSIILSFISFIIFICLLYIFLPQPFNRFKVAFNVSSSTQNIDKTSSESTAVRVLIWKESVNIIKRNVLFGVTPGDVDDNLCRAYKQNGLTGALQKQLNAHNQYLQTFLGCGVLGFLILCIFTIGALIYGIIKKNVTLIIFSFLITLNFLVESMLQAQAGFIFFVLFFCLFTKYNFSKLNNSLII